MSSLVTDIVRKIRVFSLALFCIALSRTRPGAFMISKRRTGSGKSSADTPAPRRSLVLIGAYGNSNFGDDIVAVSIVESARALNFDSVRVIGRRPDFDLLEADVPGAQMHFCGDGFAGLIETWRSIPRAGSSLDVAILGGGGLLEGKMDDVNVHRLVLEYCGKLLIARILGYTVLVHGIGVSPVLYSDRWVSRGVCKALSMARGISVRDQKSVDVLAANGIDAVLVRDPASSLFYHMAPACKRRPRTVGIVLLDRYRWPSFERARDSQETLRQEDLRAIAVRMVDWSRNGLRLELFEFHWSDGAVLKDLASVYADMGGDTEALRFNGGWRSCTEPFRRLMECGTVFTMRFHPGLAGLIAGNSVEVVGDLQKLESLRVGMNGDSVWKYPSSFGDPEDFLVQNLDSSVYPTRSLGRRSESAGR
ncbi:MULTISPECIES: polysaccharide pyruvyl transferase family protein [Rhodococcus]|uniref:polysaccharide pyruvyl transferase family protein n=1 Tax=Rhodococcus TaxID=1827 RepID=UPI00138668BF|nr:polysaccharide pyruvyl transferase family protein [Rhodococcus aetherivorans]NCL74001.1 hypothetical protein [Rhodococcus sp. YH1]NCL78877.1 hypothetical protein [Rhodococcus sp. YH1]WKW97614.1 polysaccharide pyruvyl transferase family protein [Rhodococcus aetherivorans]